MQYKYRLKEDSELYQKLLSAEDFISSLDISVETTGNTIIHDHKSGKRFLVGQQENYESFPRQTDVAFYLIEDDEL